MNMDLQTAYERIQNSKSPIEEVGTIIVATGGQWNPAEAADPTKLFTIHLHQIQGVGIGAVVDDHPAAQIYNDLRKNDIRVI